MHGVPTEVLTSKMRDKTKINTIFFFYLRVKLISRSPQWLGDNVVAFHPWCQGSILDIGLILIYALFLNRQSNVIHNNIIILSITIAIEVFTSVVRS